MDFIFDIFLLMFIGGVVLAQDQTRAVVARIGDPLHIACPDAQFVQVIWQRQNGDTIVTYTPASGNVEYENGYSAQSHSFSAIDNTLTIQTVSRSDEGESSYYCMLVIPNAVIGYNITVYHEPNEVRILSPSTVTEGDAVGVICTVPQVYPRDSLFFRIKSGASVLRQGSDVDYENSASGDIFMATFTRNIPVTRNFNNIGNKLVCEADYDANPNSAGVIQRTSNPWTSIVEYCDDVEIMGNSGQTPVGTSVEITCTAMCSPTATIRLYNESNNPNVPIRSVNATQLTYTRQLQKYDNRVNFYCDVDQGRAVSSGRIYYAVLFDATNIEMTPPPSLVEADSELSIVCTTDEANLIAEIQWSWTGSNDVSDIGTVTRRALTGCCDADKRTSTLTINSVQKEYNGHSITCALGNNAQVNNEYQLNVEFRPTQNVITANPTNFVVENNEQTVICRLSSFNPKRKLTMEWKKGNGENTGEDVTAQTTLEHEVGQYDITSATSTYRFIASSADNGKIVTCIPSWGNSESRELVESFTLTVYYPPDVRIAGCGTVNNRDEDENSDCTLTCETSNGNPSDILSYSWRFKDKFGSTFSTLPNSGMTVNLDPLDYTNAGVYECTAENAGGIKTNSDILSVIYAPIAIDLDSDSDDTKTIFAEMNGPATLSLTVHSFPSNPNFKWFKDNNNNPVSDAAGMPLHNDSTQSTLSISTVTTNATYTVEVDNGGNREKTFFIKLQTQGKPTPPHGLVKESASYRQIIVSFIPGLNGGFPQFIMTEYRQESRSSWTGPQLLRIDHPQQGVRHEVTIDEGLSATTTYDIRFVADNAHTQGTAALSEIITVTTKDKVILKTDGLKRTDNGKNVKLSWEQPRGNYTQILIRQCFDGNTGCIDHDVTDVTEITLGKANGTKFMLVVKQDRDEVESLQFKGQPERVLGPVDGPNAIMIGSIVASIVVIALITVLLVFLIRKRRAASSGAKKKNRPDAETNFTAADYIRDADPYGVVSRDAPLQHTGEAAGDAPNAVYAQVDLRTKKNNRALAGNTGEAAGDAPNAVYAQVDPRTKKNNRAPAVESNQTSNGTPKSNQPHRPAPPNPSTRPKIEAKPAPKPPAESPYTNVPQPDLLENPYSNVQDLQQGNPAPSEQGPYEPSEQGPYANVSYPPPAAPAADTNNLIYADLSFDRGQPGTAAKPQIIHGAEDTVVYSTVDFNRSAPAPQESESEDEEDVNKRQ